MKAVFSSIFVFALLPCLFSGCGKQQPILSGGKPTSYWVANVASGDIKLRRTAIAKLGNAGSTDPAVVPALVVALHDADSRVRSEAIFALLKVGPEAKGAAGDLDIPRSDRDAKICAYAAKVLEKLR